jgi:hypothetical protein
MLVDVSFVHQLMCSSNYPNFINMIKSLSDILNIDIVTEPNKNPAPLGLSLYPVISSGSLQTRSHPAPFSGIYWTLGNARIS